MKPVRKPSVILLLLLVLGAALAGWRLTSRPALPQPEVSADGYAIWLPAHLQDGLKRKDFVLVNVHTPDEGRIPGTDLAIPYDQIADHLAQLPQDKAAKIVLYCRSGRMSEIAAKELAARGYRNVISLQGGMIAWEAAGGRLEQP
jgi:rhodanese-related sulfurtransferase